MEGEAKHPGRLQGKVALITGAKQGVGKGLALGMAREGADVAILDVEDAEATVAEIRALGSRAIAVRADVSKVAEIEAAVAQVTDQFGKIDVLVNNAAIYPPAPFLKKTEAEVDRVFAIDLKGPYFCTQFVARDMVKRQVKGSVINISSGHSMIGIPIGVTDYTAAKGGINAFTRGAGSELAPYGIRVNAILLGLTRTPGMLAQPGIDKFEAALLPLFPVPRLGEPEDYVGLVVWLASDESTFATCSCYAVDGGVTGAMPIPRPPAS